MKANALEQVDKLRYIQLLKQKKYQVKDVLSIPVKERSEEENFFLRMHLKVNVPFFANYMGNVLDNICMVMK